MNDAKDPPAVPVIPEDEAAHMRDARKAETLDPHSGMSDDPRVDPTPDRRQSE